MARPDVDATRVKATLRQLGDEAGPAPAFDEIAFEARPSDAVAERRRSRRALVGVGVGVGVAAGIVLVVFLWAQGESGSRVDTAQPPEDRVDSGDLATAEDLVAAATAAGIHASLIAGSQSRPYDSVLAGRHRVICVAGGLVRVFEYDSVEARETDSEGITLEGQLESEDVDWAVRPNFYAADRLISLHLGEPSPVTEALADLMGKTLSPAALPGLAGPGVLEPGCHAPGKSISIEQAFQFRSTVINQTGRQDLSLSDYRAIGNTACDGAVNDAQQLLDLTAAWNFDVYGDDISSIIRLAAMSICLDRFSGEPFESGSEPFSAGGIPPRETPPPQSPIDGIPPGFPDFVDLSVLDEPYGSLAEGVYWQSGGATQLTGPQAVDHFSSGFSDYWTVNEVLGPVSPPYSGDSQILFWSIDIDGEAWTGVVDVVTSVIAGGESTDVFINFAAND